MSIERRNSARGDRSQILSVGVEEIQLPENPLFRLARVLCLRIANLKSEAVEADGCWPSFWACF
jgi:hypothetical protein